MSRDVTEAVAGEARLEHASPHDKLTGLPNRRLRHPRLAQALALDGPRLVVLFCDLDGFKQINDRYGHTSGDAVLVEVAARLTTTLRADDMVGRFGGGEFVCIVGVPDAEDPPAVASKVATGIRSTQPADSGARCRDRGNSQCRDRACGQRSFRLSGAAELAEGIVRGLLRGRPAGRRASGAVRRAGRALSDAAARAVSVKVATELGSVTAVLQHCTANQAT